MAAHQLELLEPETIRPPPPCLSAAPRAGRGHRAAARLSLALEVGDRDVGAGEPGIPGLVGRPPSQVMSAGARGSGVRLAADPSRSDAPERQWLMKCDLPEVRIRRQQRELESDAQLSEQRVDGSDLDSVAPTVVAKVRSCNVVAALRLQARKGGEALEDGISGARSAEALQQLLQHEAGREDWLIATQTAPELGQLGCDLRSIASQGERPHAGVDEQTQGRDRSAL